MKVKFGVMPSAFTFGFYCNPEVYSENQEHYIGIIIGFLTIKFIWSY